MWPGRHFAYAAWVAGGANPGPSSGPVIATNYGGTWHEVNMAGRPDRHIAGVTGTRPARVVPGG